MIDLFGARPIKILSVRQPWAELIVTGVKDVENRTWSTDYRGLVLILASLQLARTPLAEIASRYGVVIPEQLRRGGIVGIAHLTDVVSRHPSRFYDGPINSEGKRNFGFVFTGARTLPFVPWAGALSLRDAPKELLQRIDQGQLAEHLAR
jgi:ASCH domain